MKKAFRKSLKRQSSLGIYFKSKSENNQSSVHSTLPMLWQALGRKYRFNYPKDWYRIEAHWLDQIESFQEQPIDCPGRDIKMNNAITRISQCNESYQLCSSLPRSFIVPKDLKDVTLMDTMSTVIKNHRVPIISYCCPIEYRRNFIIRCASSDHQERVIDTLSKAVKPLKVFNLTQVGPSIVATLSAHKKLCEACRPKDENHTTNFMSKTGKWLNIISQALKMVNETAKTLLTEASVILIEDDDSGWNSVISSLIQLILEPHRRTIEGFESLISKEWIYLAGGHSDQTRPNFLFTLFLDCTYQIYLQNVKEFEFTSEYLIYLFDSQNICAHFSQQQHHDKTTDSNIIDNNNESPVDGNNHHISNISNINKRIDQSIVQCKTTYANEEDDDIIESELASYKPSSLSMIDLNLSLKDSLNSKCSVEEAHLLESGYTTYMLNPFYVPDKDSPILKVHDHIANIQFWSSLYLRWMQETRAKYGCIEEIIYFQEKHQGQIVTSELFDSSQTH